MCLSKTLFITQHLVYEPFNSVILLNRLSLIFNHNKNIPLYTFLFSSRKTENGHSNGNGNIKSPDEPELLENDKALGNTNNTSAENNVTSVSVVEKPQVSKVTLGDSEIKAVAENGVTLIQSNEETRNSLVSTSESTTVSVTQSVAKEESKESSEKTVVMIKKRVGGVQQHSAGECGFIRH